MLVVKRVCEELEEGRRSLRLCYKSFSTLLLKVFFAFGCEEKVFNVVHSHRSKKVFDEFFFSKLKRKVFQCVFPFEIKREVFNAASWKVFNAVRFHRSKKGFRQFSLSKSKGKVFDSLIIIVGKKGFQQSLRL